MRSCLIGVTLKEHIYLLCWELLIKLDILFWSLSVLCEFVHADQIHPWKLSNSMPSWAHTKQKPCLGYAKIKGKKDPGRLCGPLGVNSCLPWFWVGKSNFYSAHMGWETAGNPTGLQNWGFFNWDTGPNTSISAAGERLGEYQMGTNKLPSLNTNHHERQ